jgi:hypothetical protein
VKLWEIATGKELRHWAGIDAKSLTFTPANQYLVSANANTTLYLLECP